MTWTLDDARRAKLDGKQNWRTYPRAMLTARASAELARAMFADVIGGLAATEELEDTAPAESAQEPTSRRRVRKAPGAPVIAPPVESAPDTPPQPPLPEDDEPAEPKASDPQLRKMFALFNAAGMADRDTRLEWASVQIGRELESAAHLTVARGVDADRNARRARAATRTREQRRVMWVKLSDDWYDNRKFQQVTPLAELLYLRCLAWSCRNLSDGYVPAETVRRLTPTEGDRADPDLDAPRFAASLVRRRSVALGRGRLHDPRLPRFQQAAPRDPRAASPRPRAQAKPPGEESMRNP